MIDNFRPMLAPQEDPLSYPDYFKKLQFPLMCSAKYDGIRGVVFDGVMLSRTMKVHRSAQVQCEFTDVNYLDLELIAGKPTDPNVCHITQSHVSSYNKPGPLTGYVFDYVHPEWLNRPFYERLERAFEMMFGQTNMKPVTHVHVDHIDDLLAFEDVCLRAGFEGIMMRNPVGRYKYNARATFLENIIYKLKRFEDAEGIVRDILEGNTNNNILEVNELGYAKRSSSKENLVPSGRAGTFIVDFEGIEMEIAPGNFTHEELTEMLVNKEAYIGKYLKFRIMRYGMKDVPRFGRAVAFRDTIDM